MPLYFGYNGTQKQISNLYTSKTGVQKEILSMRAGIDGTPKVIHSPDLSRLSYIAIRISDIAVWPGEGDSSSGYSHSWNDSDREHTGNGYGSYGTITFTSGKRTSNTITVYPTVAYKFLVVTLDMFACLTDGTEIPVSLFAAMNTGVISDTGKATVNANLTRYSGSSAWYGYYDYPSFGGTSITPGNGNVSASIRVETGNYAQPSIYSKIRYLSCMRQTGLPCMQLTLSAFTINNVTQNFEITNPFTA